MTARAWAAGNSVKWTPLDPRWLWSAQYSAKFSWRKGQRMHLVLDQSLPHGECHKLAPGSPSDWDAQSRISLLSLHAWKENNTSRAGAISAARPWLSRHLGKPPCPAVRHMIDLMKAFNPAKFRWFRDEFIHRSKVNTIYNHESLPRLFGGFSTEGR